MSSNDWEQRKLGELGSLKNGMNFSKEAMGIGFPFVNLQNIFGNNVIDVTNLGKAMASDSQLKDYNLLNGDVLFVRSSVKLEGVGEAALVPQNLENTTYSGFIIRFRDEYGLDNNFKRFLFGIESVRNQIMAQATNSANKNISQTVLENLCLKIPNKSEQEKIGLYFSNLDHLITLHHRKYMKYADLSVFDWEQRKFADFTWDAGKRNKEDLDLEPYAITNEHGFIRQRDAHDDFGYMKDTDRKAYNIVQPNSFAYNPARINVGSIGYYKGVENVIVSSLYEVFQTDNYVNDRFLWHWLKSDESKTGKSGFVWHTTGSGKTLTSYKATRNLLMDIPAIDKAIFLIDRKDLDTQTTMAFQAYANNDLVDVDETDNVNDLKKKLKSDDRQVIVTTIQKMQILISKRLQEGTSEYNKIKNLKIAFVVDECHRAVTPKTKRELERFFGRSLWYGFTGTPRFAENPYPQMGDLPRTTEELYGKRLHKYTIQNAIHDNAVLGFQVEHNGPKNITDETDASAYDNETHMLRVLDIILNKSYYKLGFQNGKGQTYEGLLTTSSIQIAQKYYELLTKVKNGETSLEIDEKIKQVLPDFPKFAITYSVTENEEGSHVNQEKMQKSLDDYNQMFGTKYELSQIQGYNGNLNKRLARKDAKFKSRSEQLDLVIVVDRLLTGFDAPCMSTIFIDRQPMGPHDLIQAFSRTNRIFDKNKTYGQIVTFQAPKLFKESVDNAVKLYSAGSTGTAILAEWEEIEPAFRKSLAALRVSAETPEEVTPMSIKEKKVFVKMFQTFDRLFAQLKSFTQYDDSMLEEYGITEEEYDKYAGVYKNAVEEIKIAEGGDDSGNEPPEDETIDVDYELMAYSSTKIDYEYIINLIQNIVTPDEDAEAVSPEERQKQIDEVKQYIDEMRKDNPKVAEIMTNLVSEIEEDENKYKGQSILNIVENMKRDCIEKVISDFCVTWYASKEDVMYAALHYRNGEIPNESVIKATIDYQSYKSVQEKALPKFKYYAKCMAELKKTLDEEIKPLISVA